MQCRRCNGKGVMQLRHSRPGTEVRVEGGYKNWNPPFCVYPEHTCQVCDGDGIEPDKPNPLAGMRIHMDASGWVIDRSPIGDGK